MPKQSSRQWRWKVSELTPFIDCYILGLLSGMIIMKAFMFYLMSRDMEVE